MVPDALIEIWQADSQGCYPSLAGLDTALLGFGRAGTDAAGARWSPVEDLLAGPRRLAFDHDQILRDGVERARAKLEYSPLAAAFCSAEFTIAELRRIYEAVWGTSLDPRNFHRKVTSTAGFVTPAGSTTTRDGGRPAQLYRRGDATLLYPPMFRFAPDG